MVSFFFSISGRANRTQFWAFQLVAIGITMAVGVAFYLIGEANKAAGPPLTLPPGQMLFFVGGILLFLVVFAVCNTCVSIRRIHDRDKSGWWLLVQFIPIIGPLWLLVELGFLPGTDGPNRFDDPSPWELSSRYAY